MCGAMGLAMEPYSIKGGDSALTMVEKKHLVESTRADSEDCWIRCEEVAAGGELS